MLCAEKPPSAYRSWRRISASPVPALTIRWASFHVIRSEQDGQLLTVQSPERRAKSAGALVGFGKRRRRRCWTKAPIGAELEAVEGQRLVDGVSPVLERLELICVSCRIERAADECQYPITRAVGFLPLGQGVEEPPPFRRGRLHVGDPHLRQHVADLGTGQPRVSVRERLAE